jgi:hypothetical protein
MRPFPDDDTGAAIFDKVASDLGFPVRLERQLNAEEGLKVAKLLKAASDTLVSKGQGPSAARVARVKTASVIDLGQRAFVVSEHYMQKAASEGSLTDSEPNTPQSAAKTDQLAAVDQRNRPEGTYRGPRGETELATPGIVGREVGAPGAPTTKTAGPRLDALLTHLSDLRDSANIPGRLRAAGGRGAAVMGHVDNALERLTGNVGQNIQQVRDNQRAMNALADGPLENLGAHSVAQHFRNDALKSLGVQGGAALGVGGALAAGAHHALANRGQMSPEQLAQMAMSDDGQEVTASEQSKLAAAFTFMQALQNVTQTYASSFSPEAKVAAVGLASSGAPGVEAMHTLLSNVKTAADADEELQQILQVLTDNGAPPSPELVQALEQVIADHEAQEAAEGGGAGAPPGAPGEPGAGAPEGMEHTAGAKDYLIGKGLRGLQHLSNAGEAVAGAAKRVATDPRKLRAGAEEAQHAANRAAMGPRQAWESAEGHAAHLKSLKGERNKNLAAMGAQGVAAAGTVAAGAAGAHHLAKKKSDEKTAAMWSEILKAAGEGSLTDSETNTPESAAKTDQLAAVDQKNRPDGKYEDKKGKSDLKTESGEVGDEKKASALYDANLKLAADTYGRYLPATMPLDEKRAHIAKIASLPPSEREPYVLALPTS